MSNVNNVYNYTDNHLYFWFNGRHSSEFNLFIEAKNDLKIENTTSPSIQFNNAMFQEGSYFLGASRTQKNFKRKVAAKGLTWERYREMMLWLMEGATGMLFFDSNPYWGWSVVLDKLGDSNVWYDSDDTMIVEFEVSWKTIGTWMATNRYDSGAADADGDVVANNPWGLPAYTVNDDNTITVFSLCNAIQYVDISGLLDSTKNTITVGRLIDPEDSDSVLNYLHTEFFTDAELADKENKGKVILRTTGDIYLDYYGLMNMLFVNDNIAERDGRVKSSSQTRGVMELQAKAPKLITMPLSDQDIDLWKERGYRHIIATQELENNPVFDVTSLEEEDIYVYTHTVTIYDIEESPTSFQNDCKYYLVHSNVITHNGIVAQNDNDPITVKVHSYNIT